MGKHSRDSNDPAQRAADFDERDTEYTKAGKQREFDKYKVVDSGSGDSCAVGLAILSGITYLGYVAASAVDII